MALLVVVGIVGRNDLPTGAGGAGSESVSSSATPLSITTSPAIEQSAAPTPAGGNATSEQATTALQALAVLLVQDRASKVGYSRDQFGQTWSDDVTVDGGHNGCDTRNDILRRDLAMPQIKAGTQGCLVLSGTLADPYTAQSILFVRGSATSGDVQIDHLVALSDGWQSGAQQLTAAQRQDFANDPINLQAVSGPINEAKGDGDAATWLPPNIGYRCMYVTRQIEVKARYELWVKPAEHDAMARILTSCGAVPATSAVPEPLDTGLSPITEAPVAPATAPEPNSSGYFKNCAAARAAGAAPLYLGQPGYRDPLDGDHDGVACEPVP